jgi:hypothetical protein
VPGRKTPALAGLIWHRADELNTIASVNTGDAFSPVPDFEPAGRAEIALAARSRPTEKNVIRPSEGRVRQ